MMKVDTERVVMAGVVKQAVSHRVKHLHLRQLLLQLQRQLRVEHMEAASKF